MTRSTVSSDVASMRRRLVILQALLLVTVVGRAGAQPNGSAPARASLPGLHHESVAFDAGRGRLVVVFSAGDSLDGTWEWDGRAWVMVADSASSPTWRYGATMGYDPANR